MDRLLDISIDVLLYLIAALILVKFLILKIGRPIKAKFSSFFWFSRWEILNSSYDYSKKKRIFLNNISLVILLLIVLETALLIISLWQDL